MRDRHYSSVTDCSGKWIYRRASGRGADLSAGYTVNYSTELIVYRTIREIADEMVIVLDSFKFDKKTFLSLGRLTLSDTVVSDKGVPQQYIDYYEKNNIKILI